MTPVDVAVIGAGPAGLAAALHLVRARRSTVLIDSNRPRNAATLASHGFLTRDGISPLELRRLGREEFERYPDAVFRAALVDTIERAGDVFRLTGRGIRGAEAVDLLARTIVIAVGLTEVFPRIENIRAWYGTALHSCIECDGYEKSDAPLALIGETADLYDRALLIRQWSRDLVVFTNGMEALTAEQEADLVRLGVSVERRIVASLEGENGTMTGLRLADGAFVPRAAGFVRPLWRIPLPATKGMDVSFDVDGLIGVDSYGRTGVAGVYAAGDITAPGPEQLIVAAGDGARVGAAINRDLILGGE